MSRSRTPNIDTVVPPETIQAPNAGRNGDGPDDDLGDLFDLEAPELQEATCNVYRLNPDGTVPEGSKVGRFLGKVKGAPNQEKIKARWGGGCFRLILSLPDRTRRWTIVSIEGEPVIEAAPAPAPPASSSTATGPLEAMMQRLEAMHAEIQELKRAPAATLDPVNMFSQAVQLVQQLTPRPNEMAMFEVLQRGIQIGERGGDREESIADMVKEALPVIVDAFKRPAPAALAGGAAQRPKTRVVDGVTQRKLVLLGILSDAIANNKDVRDLADTADHVLSDAECAGLQAATLEQLLQSIGGPLLEQYPAVNTPEGRAYLGRFLEELRRPADDDNGDATPSGA